MERKLRKSLSYSVQHRIFVNQLSPIESYWEHTAFTSADICIVGAGIIGLSTALSCREKFPDATIVILERSNHSLGATTRNAGFACFGSASELLHDIDTYGFDNAFEIASERYAGLQLLRKRCADETIQFESFGGYELIREKELHVLDRLHEVNALASEFTGNKEVYSIVDAHTQQNMWFGSDVKAIVMNPLEGQIHSGKLHARLERLVQEQSIRIEYGSEVTRLDEEFDCCFTRINTAFGAYTLQARMVILCNNASMSLLKSELPIKPGRGQVLVTNPIEQLPFKGTFHIDEGFYYFRNIGQRVLLGGGRNLQFEQEETFEFGINPVIHEALIEMMKSIIIPRKDFSIDYSWSGIMGFTPDKLPIVKAMSNTVIAAFGCNGMGVALGSMIGEKAATLAYGMKS